MLCSFPEVPECTSQVGRPDDGTDATGFFNTEYFVGLKPKEEWRPVFHQDKDRLIAAMNRELEQIPGVTWGFSQPIEDNMEEAVSGVKGELATKVYGDDLKVLEEKADQIVSVMQQVRGIEDLGVFRALGQPNINFEVNREQAARYQINVADIQDAIQTAVGGSALTQVLQGEQRYDLVLRYLPQYRTTKEALENIRLLSPSGERVSLAQLCNIKEQDGGSEIYREENQRYVAIKYSVRGRDLGSAVEEAMRNVNAKVQLPRGYHIDWEGEYESQKRAQARLLIIVPLTILVIFMIIYSMFRSPKWAALILATVAMASAGGLLALLVTGTHFSVSSGVGFLALFGVSVQTGVIMLEYINQLRARGGTIEDSAIDGAVLRLRPIMMTMLVATLGLLPAALSHAIGSDSQRPFAIVIVGGLMVNLAMSIFHSCRRYTCGLQGKATNSRNRSRTSKHDPRSSTDFSLWGYSMTEDVRAAKIRWKSRDLRLWGPFESRAARVSQVLVEPHRLKPVLLRRKQRPSSVILSGNAEVAELADAPALGAGGRKAVGVRVPSSAPTLIFIAHSFEIFIFATPPSELTLILIPLYSAFAVPRSQFFPVSIFPDREAAKSRSTNLRAVPDVFRSSDNAICDPEGLTMSEATCRRELELEIPAETVQKAVERVAKEFARVARVPGFRPGKAPITLIRRSFADDIKSEVLQSLVPEQIERAVTESKLVPVTQPQVDKVDFTETGPVKFRATFEVLPEFELGQYKDLEVEVEDLKIEDSDVDKGDRRASRPRRQLSFRSKAGPSPTAITRSSS